MKNKCKHAVMQYVQTLTAAGRLGHCQKFLLWTEWLWHILNRLRQIFLPWNCVLKCGWLQTGDKYWYVLTVASVIIWQCVATDIYAFHSSPSAAPLHNVTVATTTSSTSSTTSVTTAPITTAHAWIKFHLRDLCFGVLYWCVFYFCFAAA